MVRINNKGSVMKRQFKGIKLIIFMDLSTMILVTEK